ncbi:MAG: lipoyl(octanoyl) transferase [Desulfobacula sp. RIFOXYB2_FULL_45_6]|nr:MAG: lipoyl(octanoyl) transferase [Desulfobacula sp. RIFOXYB2_FULL_45_6]
MPEGVSLSKRSAVFIDLGLMEYKKALALQAKTLESKINRMISEDYIFFVEHPPVFTLGKRGGEENLTVSREFLKSKKIDVIQTDRGGNITFHGPGQAVLYPIVDLENKRIGVKDFVFGLEEIMKQTLLDFGINADRKSLNHGIWVGDAKIGSVGISIKKGISIHGLAMNIYPDLEPFSWINPCGLTNISMTSIEKEIKKRSTSAELPMKKIKESFIKHFSSLLNYDISEHHAD